MIARNVTGTTMSSASLVRTEYSVGLPTIQSFFFAGKFVLYPYRTRSMYEYGSYTLYNTYNTNPYEAGYS